ncbi:NAD(P)-dependent oxidoreductase [Streptacidiphilus sp. NEAU-YB345]|uniref:NAD(P)-dependent oxidoreductase n=2 Tax=Streptacidiphilus fuscans TaxID=2789292 RepID=A0A931B3J6_9ACTN|nr:NAD(P)-dependent oxidoreductase [Streptacidiphilus fuscans]
MGAGMARSLRREGLAVRAWNRSREKAEPLAASGAVVCASADEAVRGADVVLTVLNDGAAVRATMEAARPGLREGQIWLQASTVGLPATEELAALADSLGLVYVDSPVAGTRQPAEQGQLTVFAAGPESARAAVAPVLDAIGRRTVWVGTEPGRATALKLVVNTWVIDMVSSVAESLNLAEALGVDPALFLDAVAGGPLDTPYLHAKSAAVLSGDLTANFAVTSALKDTSLILAAAAETGARLDLVEASAARLTRAAASGHGDEDVIATYFAGRPDPKGE